MIPANPTNGQLYNKAMAITDQAEADAYLEELIQHNMAHSEHSWEEADEIERSNIGYYGGYHSKEVRARIEKLFHCIHPLLGSVAHRKQLTPQELFDLGRKVGTSSKIETLKQPRRK